MEDIDKIYRVVFRKPFNAGDRITFDKDRDLAFEVAYSYISKTAIVNGIRCLKEEFDLCYLAPGLNWFLVGGEVDKSNFLVESLDYSKNESLKNK